MPDVAIVGAGPAGLAAAQAISERGLSVAVIDEQQRPGGQIFRQPPREFSGSSYKFSTGYRWGKHLLDWAENSDSVQWLFGCTAFGILQDEGADVFRVAIAGAKGARTIEARYVLIATGAFDMPVAFPGWTMPGVYMAGAVQSFTKSQKLLVSKRLVLAGSHPLLLVAADQLRSAGADIAEIAFARGVPTLPEIAGSLGAVPGHLGLFAETGFAVARLLAAGVKFSTHTMVNRVSGNEHVEQVELVRVDRAWRNPGSPRIVKTSALVLGYGFQPSAELARQAGCAMTWNSRKGGWVVEHDDLMQTSVPRVYVAGEPTGIGGAEQSRAEGHLAGLAIAQHALSKQDRIAEDVRSARRGVRHAERFSTVVQRMFEPKREALLERADPQTIVCRCELVRRVDIERTLEANPEFSTANAVKLECRSGMGPCQGRYCETSVATLVARHRAIRIDQTGHFNAHLPVKPVPLDALAALDD